MFCDSHSSSPSIILINSTIFECNKPTVPPSTSMNPSTAEPSPGFGMLPISVPTAPPQVIASPTKEPSKGIGELPSVPPPTVPSTSRTTKSSLQPPLRALVQPNQASLFYLARLRSLLLTLSRVAQRMITKHPIRLVNYSRMVRVRAPRMVRQQRVARVRMGKCLVERQSRRRHDECVY